MQLNPPTSAVFVQLICIGPLPEWDEQLMINGNNKVLYLGVDA